MRQLQIILVSGFLLITCGCRIIQPVQEPKGHYYLNPQSRFSELGKVVILELENESSRQDLAESLTQALADALQKKHLFSVRCIHRSDPLWQGLELYSISEYSYEQLSMIRKMLGADAIVFGNIMRYTPYPHLGVGLRLKMVDLRYGSLVWALEEVWDSTDKSTEQRMRQFFDRQMRTGYQPMNWEILITSPMAFHKFVVYEAAQTLPELAVSRPASFSSENIPQFSKGGLIEKKSR